MAPSLHIPFLLLCVLASLPFSALGELAYGVEPPPEHDLWGGEDSFILLGHTIAWQSGVHNFGTHGDFPPSTPFYAPTSSDTAQVKFNKGNISLAVSDYPMTDYRSTWGTSRTPGKYTIPIAFSGYGFFVNAPSPVDVQLTPAQTYDIFLKYGSKWEDYAPGVLSGPITRFARKDASAANYILKKFWCAAGVHCPRLQNDGPMNFYSAKYVEGTVVYAMQASYVPGAIMYSQVGVVQRMGGSLSEIALQNQDGNYVRVTDGSGTAPTLSYYPAFKDRWSHLEFVYQPGSTTAPMISLMVAFLPKLGTIMPPGQFENAVKLLTTALQHQSLLQTNSYLALPSDLQALTLQFVASL